MSWSVDWFTDLFAHWMRPKTSAVALPAWPRGASLRADLCDVRRGREMVSISLRRDEVTGKICDADGRELVSVEICSQNRRDFRQGPDEILRALSSEALAGGVITLLLVDHEVFMGSSANSCRMGLHFIDATCVWVESAEGFGEVIADAELAAA